MAYDLQPAVQAVQTLAAYPAQAGTAQAVLSQESSFFNGDDQQILTGLRNLISDVQWRSSSFGGDIHPYLSQLVTVGGQINTLFTQVHQAASTAQLGDTAFMQQLEANQSLLGQINQVFAQFSQYVNMKFAMMGQISADLFRQYGVLGNEPPNGGGTYIQVLVYNINQVKNALDTFNTQSAAANNAIGTIMGTCVGFQTEWNAAQDTVAKAVDAPSFNAALTHLYVDVAAQEWAAFWNVCKQLSS
jgi:hypothetical protein